MVAEPEIDITADDPLSYSHGSGRWHRQGLVCSVETCPKRPVARDLCAFHYRRWSHHGDPLYVPSCKSWDGLCKRCKAPGPFHAHCRICKACHKENTYDGRARSPERSRTNGAIYAARRHRERRALVLEVYGSACKCCGETEPAFLALDHINGGGNAHRRSMSKSGKSVGGGNLYQWIVSNGFPTDFQLLCHNCNFAKSHGGCPHALKSSVVQ